MLPGTAATGTLLPDCEPDFEEGQEEEKEEEEEVGGQE